MLPAHLKEEYFRIHGEICKKKRVDILANSINTISLMMLHSNTWASHQNSPEFEIAFWLEEAKNLARGGGCLDFVWKAK